MVERWSILFGDVLVMGGIVSLFGLIHLTVWQAIAALLIGLTGVIIGLHGNEERARSYFQVIAICAGVGLVMALGAVLSGAYTLFGIPLNVGSFILFIVVVAAMFFAGFEPEVSEDHSVVLAPQRN